MKSIQSKGTMGKFLLTFSLLLGIGIMSSMTAQAQRRKGRRSSVTATSDGGGSGGGTYDLRQTAQNAGFADGVKDGRKDRQRGDRSDYKDEVAYQKGTRGFNPRLGKRNIYQRIYREAFSHGYADGYNGY